MAKLLLGSFLAALALFFWGFIYYGISSIPHSLLGQSDDATALLLKERFPEDGVYVLPHPKADQAPELMQRGPIATVHIKGDGIDSPATMMIQGFLHGWLYCLLLAVLLKQICKKTGYAGRVGFVALVAAAGALYDRFGDAIWWHQSWSWQLSNFAYAVIGATLAGLVLAKFVPQEKRPSK